MGTENKAVPPQPGSGPAENDPIKDPDLDGVEQCVSAQAATEACLVIINTSHHNLLGWTYRLGKALVSVGRSPSNEVVIDDPSVSRRHCTIELLRERFVIRDLGSSNGTRYNGEKFKSSERILSNLDRLRIGHSEFIFLQGPDIEQRRRQALDSFSALDGVSGAFNQRAFEVLVSRVLEVANSEKKQVCLMLIQLDDLQKIRQNLGQMAGDTLLSGLTAQIRHRLRHRDLIGRMGSNNVLAVVITKHSLARCIEIAGTIREEYRRNPISYEGQPLLTAVTVGIAPYVFGADLKTWIRMADDSLYLAIRAGGNCVRPEPSESDEEPSLVNVRAMRRISDAEQVVRKALTSEITGPILAFEIEDEGILLDCVGESGRDRWFHELEDEVLDNTQFDEEVGTWLNRYVIAVLSRTRATPADEVVRSVTEAFGARSVPSEMVDFLQRKLRVASLEPAELSIFKERALHELAQRLVAQADPDAELAQGSLLPFPLAAPLLRIETRRRGPARIKAQRDAIESAFRFIVALEVALLRADERLLPRLAETLHGTMDRPLPLTAWIKLAWQCAAMAPASLGGISEVLKTLLDKDGRPSLLVTRLQEAVGQGGRTAASGGPPAPAAEGDERLSELIELLVRALAPLAECTLIRLQEMQSFDEEKEEGIFDLHILSGPSARFPVEPRTLSSIIGYKDWCYLLHPALAKPLILAPMVALKVCPVCQRYEVFLADRIALGPVGGRVSLRGVLTAHEVQIDVPKIKPIRALYEQIEAIRRAVNTCNP